MSPTTHGTQTGVVAALRFLWPYWSLLLQPACLHSPPSRTNPHGSIIQRPSALLSFATKFLNQRNNSWSTKISSTIRFGEYKILHFKFKAIVAFLQSVNLCQRKNVVVGLVDNCYWTDFLINQHPTPSLYVALRSLYVALRSLCGSKKWERKLKLMDEAWGAYMGSMREQFCIWIDAFIAWLLQSVSTD